MYSKVLHLTYRLENHPMVSSIKKGFLLLLPMLLTGSAALLLRNFPNAYIQSFLLQFAGGFFGRMLLVIVEATNGFMSVYLVLSISYFYSAVFAPENISLRIMAMITACSCFVASYGAASGSLTLACFDQRGVFTAMVCSILSTRLFFALFHRLSNGIRSYTAGADDHYKNSIAGLMPFLICVLLFTLANLLLNVFFHVNNFNDLITLGLSACFQSSGMGSELAGGLLFTFFINVFWGVGVHGGNALDQVAQAVFVPANTDASLMISKSFMDNFASIGGSGTAICLVLALLIVSKSDNNRRLARTAAPLALFNINELLVFGLPIVLNPVLLIPFVAVPLCSLLIAYGATALGFMPLVNITIEWTTPVFFSGYLATGSWTGAVVQLVIITVGTLIYIPFVKIYENMQRTQEESRLEQLTALFHENEKLGVSAQYLSRSDNYGVIAKSIISQLHQDILRSNITMYYQPQLDTKERLIGAEALLRWEFAGCKVYPPLVVALAKEDGCYDDLTLCIFERACTDLIVLRSSTHEELQVSVNISADQLNNRTFILHLIGLANTHAVCGNLVLEVTEETSLGDFEHITENIELLYQNNIPIAIDDFSMGQTSINYLQNNKFQYVKLDGELVRQACGNVRCQKIISSIVTLGGSLGFKVTAEYVENTEVLEILTELGCHYFQGYLYSPAVGREEFIAYYHSLSGKAAKQQSLK